MNITRIKPPKWRVGKYVLNEYEVRCLMADVCLGKKEPGIKITDEDGNTAEILPDGRLTNNLKGFDVASNFTLILIRESRRKEREKLEQVIESTHYDRSSREIVKVDLNSLKNRFEYGLQADFGESYEAIICHGEKKGQKILVYPKDLAKIT